MENQNILENTNIKNLNVHFNSKTGNVSDISETKSDLENDLDNSIEEFENKKGKNEENNSNNSFNQDEEEYEDDEEDEEFQTVKDRQEAINVSHPFGLRLWKPALYKKHRSIFTTTHEALHSRPGMSYSKTELYLHPGNILWAITFGWVMALLYLATTFIVLGSAYVLTRFFEIFLTPKRITLSPKPKQSRLIFKYMKLLLSISGYIFWPFGKYIERVKGNISDDVDYYAAIQTENNENIFSEEVVGNYSRKRNEHFSQKTKNEWSIRRIFSLLFKNGFSGFVFYLCMFLLIAPMHLIASAITWMFVVSIPMCKLCYLLLNNLFNDPLELYVHSSSPPPFQFQTLFKKIHHSSNDEATLPLVNDNSAHSASSSTTAHGNTSYANYNTYTTNQGNNNNNDFINKNYQLSGQSEIILCTYKAIGFQYSKYTLDGINVWFINSLLFVVFTLVDAYFIAPRTHHTGIGSPAVIFFSSLISVIPLAYFIGMSVSSITAQTNLALGAVINATFGSIIEVILYTIALMEGKAKIVEGSLIGSILAGILALPGMSMLTGGLKRKEQRFNAKSAGVSSTLLILSIIGVFIPTLFQIFFGTYNLECKSCPEGISLGSQGNNILSNNITSSSSSSSTSSLFDQTFLDTSSIDSKVIEKAFMKCENCKYVQPEPLEDSFYFTHTKPLVYFCAIMLILTYAVGLLFTLRTHVKQIYEKKVKRRPSKRSRSRTGRSHSRRRKSMDDHHVSSTSSTPTSATTPLTKEVLIKINNAAANSDDIIYHANGKTSLTATATTNEPTSTTTLLHNNLHISAPKPDLDAVSVISSGSESGSDVEKEAKGHEAPNWSNLKSTIVLLVSTVTFSLLAEELIASVDVVLKSGAIDEKFLGITLFALAPNVSEFYNAIAFAIYGNIELSLEIGSAYAIQVSMLQIPSLVMIYAVVQYFTNLSGTNFGFSLIFSKWDVVTIVIGVFLLSHIYNEGKSNYFKGAMLLLAYLVFVISYFFIPTF